MAFTDRGHRLPVAALLVSATLWGLLWWPLRWLAAHGLQGLWSTLIIFAIPMCLGLPYIINRRREVFRRVGLLSIVALANGWCNTAFILAVLDGPVVRVLLLFYLSPLWAVLLAKLILGESLSRHGKATLLLAMIGAALMLWDPSLHMPWPRDAADWLAISSGFAFSLSNVYVRSLQDVTVATKTVASWCGVAALAAVSIAVMGTPLPPMSAPPLAAAAALGACGITIMTLAVQYGVTHMPVHRSAVILLFELVAGTASSQWLTDEVVSAREWIGGLLIISAAWFAARAQLRQRD
jgi:drug/metabolite transporter (DMT)-like permease